jgi:hypothetical protein
MAGTCDHRDAQIRHATSWLLRWASSKTRKTTRHEAASLVIGRRALAHPARRRTPPPRQHQTDADTRDGVLGDDLGCRVRPRAGCGAWVMTAGDDAGLSVALPVEGPDLTEIAQTLPMQLGVQFLFGDQLLAQTELRPGKPEGQGVEHEGPAWIFHWGDRDGPLVDRPTF